jgi:glycosyltransferase 2 family protein
VQEGGYIAFGHVFGVPPETALALSLVKRVPDLAIGAPTLVTLYLTQLRRLFPNPVGPDTPPPTGATSGDLP